MNASSLDGTDTFVVLESSVGMLRVATLFELEYLFSPSYEAGCRKTAFELSWKLRGMLRTCCSSFTLARTFLTLFYLFSKPSIGIAMVGSR